MPALVEAARFPREEEAVVAVTFLQAHGLHASLFDHAHGAASAGYAYLGAFRVMVPEADVVAARRRIADVENGPSPAPEHDPNANCLHCGGEAILPAKSWLAAAVMFVASRAPVTWMLRCGQCGYEWKAENGETQ